MIPIIDLQEKKPQEFSQKIVDAMESVGFLYLKNIPGLPYSEAERLFNTADKFWKLEESVKKQYGRPKDYEKEGNTGYVGPGIELLDPTSKAEIREAYNVTPHVEEKMIFPDKEVPELRKHSLDFFAKCRAAALDIMEAIAKGLKLQDTQFFERTHKFIGKGPNATTIRLLHYPPLPDYVEPGTARCGAHSDYGSITLLFQDYVGGLEVLDREGSWVPATPVKDAVLVNTGDLLQMWTNDRILATKHRVLVPADTNLWKSERRSLAFFVHPDDDCLVKPLDGSTKYQPITAKKHLMKMFSTTY